MRRPCSHVRAAAQLLQAGRKRILYLYTSYSYSGVNKLEGYKDALKAYGMEPVMN